MTKKILQWRPPWRFITLGRNGDKGRQEAEDARPASNPYSYLKATTTFEGAPSFQSKDDENNSNTGP